MSKRRKKPEFKWAGGYTARPKRSRVVDGIEEHYWTVRNRRAESRGEWTLGWFTSLRAAERAFQRWVHDTAASESRPQGMTSPMEAVIDAYCEAVSKMAQKRPSTIWNRQYTAKKLREFIGSKSPEIAIGEFSDEHFEVYLDWLTAEQEIRGKTRCYSPQTVQNFLRGARVFLRWAETNDYIDEPPKEPAFEVEQRQHRPLYEQEVLDTIEQAPAPLDTMLRLMWATGMRYGEAATLRAVDLNLDEGQVKVRRRGTFKPKTTRSTRAVAVSDELLDELQGLATGEPNVGLFPCPHEAHYPYWRHRLYAAQTAAGIPRFTFHDLRRTFAIGLRRSGAPVDVYCDILGHSAITGLRHYATVTSEDQRSAQERALEFMRKRKPRRRKQSPKNRRQPSSEE